MPFIQIPYPPKFPLTESERKWLKEREERFLSHGGYFCIYCQHFNPIPDPFDGHCEGIPEFGDCKTFPTNREWNDCAEFEACVALKLAGDTENYFEIKNGARSPLRWKENMFMRLIYARLDVEKEME